MYLAMTDEECLVVAGDNLMSFDFNEFYNSYKKNDCTTIAAYDIKDIEIVRNRHGVVILDDNNKVIDFQEKPSEPKSTMKSICCYLFPAGIKSKINEYLQGNNRDSPGFVVG